MESVWIKTSTAGFLDHRKVNVRLRFLDSWCHLCTPVPHSDCLLIGAAGRTNVVLFARSSAPPPFFSAFISEAHLLMGNRDGGMCNCNETVAEESAGDTTEV